MITRHVTVDHFFADVRAMVRELDLRLGARAPFDPRRYVWELWNVDGQFSQLRTPARSFFPEAVARAFEARLLRWAGATFGLSRLGGPPWLSSVTDGGFQNLHRDGPNGQIAFTFGLGKKSTFRGGETMIANDDLLDYFRTGSHREAVAHTPLFDEIAPRLNRLVAFDSRIPHAVRKVEGPRSARDGRIAIQGWLEADGCVLEGATDRAIVLDATRATNVALAKIPRAALAGTEGLVAARLELRPDGRVRDVDLRASTLARTSDARGQPARAEKAIAHALAKARFSAGISRVTAPVRIDERARAQVPTKEPTIARSR